MNKIMFMLFAITVFTGCKLNVAQSDNTTYNQMREYGVNYIKSSGDSSDIVVLSDGHRLKIIEADVFKSEDWYLKDSLKIDGFNYSSFISRDSKEVLLKNSY